MADPVTETSAGLPAQSEYDHLDPTLTHAQVWGAYSEMRERCPVVHSERHGGHLQVLRYRDVRDVAGRADDFISGDGGFIPPSGLPRLAPLDYDGQEHATWRALMQGPLSPAAVRDFVPTMNAVIDEHIDAFAHAGSAELFSALAEPLPAHIVGYVMGLRGQDCRTLRKLAIAPFKAIGSSDFDKHNDALGEFIQRQVDQRRREPTGDFLTHLVSAEVDGAPLSNEDIKSALTTLFIGGHHSTASAMSGLFYHVLSVPGLREIVAAGGPQLTALIEESLRVTTPVHIFARTASLDTSIGDIPVAAGTRLFVNYASANHDPRRFEEPEQFLIDRKPNAHLTFGFGPHLCLGRHLARAELKSTVTRLFSRLPDLELAGDIEYSTLQGGKLLEIEHLPVRFTPEHS
jgi:cytochrome P450